MMRLRSVARAVLIGTCLVGVGVSCSTDETATVAVSDISNQSRNAPTPAAVPNTTKLTTTTLTVTSETYSFAGECPPDCDAGDGTSVSETTDEFSDGYVTEDGRECPPDCEAATEQPTTTQPPTTVALTVAPTPTPETVPTTTIWERSSEQGAPSCQETRCGPARIDGRLWRMIITSQDPYRFELEVSDGDAQTATEWRPAPIDTPARGAVQEFFPFTFRNALYVFVSADDKSTNNITLLRSTDHGLTWETHGRLPIGAPDGWPNGINSNHVECDTWIANVDSEGSVVSQDAGRTWTLNGGYVDKAPTFREADCAAQPPSTLADPSGGKRKTN